MQKFSATKFSERLREIRRKYGGNIGLANLLGLTAAEIGNYTQHKKPRTPSVEFLTGLAGFGEDITYLLTGHT